MKVAVLMVVLLSAAPAVAGGKDEARRYFQAGNQAYQAGQYRAAAAAYEESLRRNPLPATRFTLAQALRRQYYVDQDVSHLERALELYRRYLDEVPSGGRRAHAVTHIAEIVAILHASPPRAPPAVPTAPPPSSTQLMVVARVAGATAQIDGGPAALLPLTREVAPGRHRVRARAPGFFPAEVEWLAVAGRLVLAEMTLEPRPAVLEVRAGGAEIRVDGRRAPGPRLVLPAGDHLVAVTRRGHRSFQQRLHLRRGGTRVVDVDLQPTRQRIAACWVLGGAAAGLVASAITAGVAVQAQSRATAVLQLRAPGRSLSSDELDRYNRALDRRDRFRTTALILLGTATALAVTGATLFRFDEPSLQPVLDADLAGASFGGRF